MQQGGLLISRLGGAKLRQIVQIESKRLLIPATSIHVVTHHQNNLRGEDKINFEKLREKRKIYLSTVPRAVL
jgi:hypothetical protein